MCLLIQPLAMILDQSGDSDVKMPSEHTICGKRYPAELSIFMLHPNRRQTIAMSILMDIDLYGNTNHHFQKAIDGWQSVFDQNSYRCNEQKQTARKMHTTKNLSSATNSTFEDIAGLLFAGEKLFEAANSTRRNLIDETPYGKGGWDPFHPSLERVSLRPSIIFCIHLSSANSHRFI